MKKIRFAAAYEETKNAVYGYLLYMTKSVELAEDLSQETFLKMFLNMGKFKGLSSVKTWALKIARNTFLTYAKRKQPILLEEQSLEQMVGCYENEPEATMLRKEEGKRIQDIMLALNEQDRTVLLLCDYEKLSYDDIAEIMSISNSAIKSRIYRARQRFIKLYQDEADKMGAEDGYKTNRN